MKLNLLKVSAGSGFCRVGSRRLYMKSRKLCVKVVCISVLSAVIALCLASCSGLSAWTEGRPSVFDTDTDGGTSGESETSEAEEKENRFDYFAADMNEYVKLDTSVCKDMSVTISPDYIVTDADVQEYIDALCFSRKSVANDGAKVTDEPIKRGDTAYIFYRGEIDGEEFDGGSNMSDETPFGLSIGSGNFIGGFEEGLVGVVPSQTSAENPVTLNLKFNESYGNRDLAGKDVTFYVYVLYTIQYDIPEYDEDFITGTLEFEAEGSDVVGEHKAYIRGMLEEENESEKSLAIENAIWEILLDEAEIIKYPQDEIQYYYDSYVDDFEYAMNYYMYMGYVFDDFNDFAVQYMGLEDGADWKAALTEECETLVAQNLIYHAISQFDGLELTEEEFQAEVQYNIDYYKAQGQGTYTEEQIIEMLGEDYIRESALYIKIMDVLMENCTVAYSEN